MTPITLGDVSDVVRICILAPIAWITPQRYWLAIGAALARIQARLIPARRRDLENRLPSYLIDLSGLNRSALAQHLIAAGYEEEMAILRSCWPGGWRPEIRLAGKEFLDTALSQGKGAVLWVEDIHFASLVVKMAFAERGYQVSHLSRPSHGFSNTPFARRYLNPIRWRFEDRYLKQRLVLVRSDPAILRQMRTELGNGGIISITVGNNGSQIKTVPFFDSELELATGAVTLARAAGAALLPVFMRSLPSGGFEVRIEPPLSLEGSRDEDAAFVQFAELLASYVKAYPLQWKGWAFRGPALLIASKRRGQVR